MHGDPVLIVTRKFDPHADQVIAVLRRRAVPFFRFNTDDFHDEYRVTANDGGPVTIADAWGRTHRFPDDTRAVWYRKPVPPAPPQAVTDTAARTVILRETQEFLDCLSTGTTVPWVNNPYANLAAARKWPQLNLARSLGLRVPDTIVTNDPTHARAFHAEAGGRLLCKPMKATGFEDGAAFHAMFSREIPAEEIDQYAGQVAHCPTLLQEYIEKDHELRITIAGDMVFCCRVDSQAVDGAKIDWRRVDPFDVPHEIVALPGTIETALKAMLTRYDLRFGTFDMIVTPAGEYVFLELNPNGQWLWIELITGAPIAAALADLLAG